MSRRFVKDAESEMARQINEFCELSNYEMSGVRETTERQSKGEKQRILNAWIEEHGPPTSYRQAQNSKSGAKKERPKDEN